MDFNEKKEIKDKKNEIENLKMEINNNLERINDVVINNNFDFILDDIRNNVEINKFSMSSIFDFSEPLYSESKNYIENNSEFIVKLLDDNILKYIGNDFKDIFKNINITINLYIVENLYFDDDVLELDLYNLSISEFEKYLNDCQCNYDVLDYLDYLEEIYYFYDSLNDLMLKFIKDYGKYIL